MITGSTVWTLKGQGPSLACSLSESKGPHSAPWLFPEPLRRPTQGWGLGREEPGTPGPTPAGRPPFTHQGKGTQQAIPTRSPTAQYSNSWGRWEGPGIQRKEWSGQRKNTRDCEKELQMKCEKQRRQGEDSSNPKRGTGIFSPA